MDCAPNGRARDIDCSAGRADPKAVSIGWFQPPAKAGFGSAPVSGGETFAFLQLAERLVDKALGSFLVAAVEICRGMQIGKRAVEVALGPVDLRIAPLRQRAGGERANPADKKTE